MHINPHLLLLSAGTLASISNSPAVHLALRKALLHPLSPLITSKKKYEWTERAYFECANTEHDFETQQAVPEKKMQVSSLSSQVSCIKKNIWRDDAEPDCVFKVKIRSLKKYPLNFYTFTINTGWESLPLFFQQVKIPQQSKAGKDLQSRSWFQTPFCAEAGLWRSLRVPSNVRYPVVLWSAVENQPVLWIIWIFLIAHCTGAEGKPPQQVLVTEVSPKGSKGRQKSQKVRKGHFSWSFLSRDLSPVPAPLFPTKGRLRHQEQFWQQLMEHGLVKMHLTRRKWKSSRPQIKNCDLIEQQFINRKTYFLQKSCGLSIGN